MNVANVAIVHGSRARILFNWRFSTPLSLAVFNRAHDLQWLEIVEYQNLRDRTFAFAVATIDFCRKLPATWEAQRIRAQLFDSGTSVGANYRAAGRARSDSEFIAKLGTVVEEADESEFWLALLKAANVDASAGRDALAKEATELRAIFVTSRKTAIENKKRRRARESASRRRPSNRE